MGIQSGGYGGAAIPGIGDQYSHPASRAAAELGKSTE